MCAYNPDRIKHIYEGCGSHCDNGVLQGALWDLSIFHSFQSVDVFSLDRNLVSSLELQALNADK